MRLAGNVADVGEMRSVFSILIRNPEGKRPFGKPGHRRNNSIKMDHREIGLEGVD
jgi:hypothetical protein